MTTAPTVVVGVDGSASSEAACAVACAEAASRRLPLTLLHAWETYPALPSGLWTTLPSMPDPSELERLARQTLVRTRDLVARAAPDVEIELRLVRSSPVDALLTAGRTAALLVVGGVDRGRHEVGWLGSVPLHVAGHAPCPVIVVPTGAPTDGPVVVGVDDSGLSTAAVAFAFEQASRWHRELVAVHAFTSTWGTFVTDSGHLADLHERARAELSEALVGWSEKHPDVRVTDLVSTEHPVRALRCAAADASLLVLGSHGRGAVARYAMGSISATLLRVAPCAVAVVTTS
jgi:nucleotide-binding universal stress UspA family protein